jgi:hypothetical protein
MNRAELGRNELRPYNGRKGAGDEVERARRARPFEAQGKRAVPLREKENVRRRTIRSGRGRIRVGKF